MPTGNRGVGLICIIFWGGDGDTWDLAAKSCCLRFDDQLSLWSNYIGTWRKSSHAHISILHLIFDVQTADMIPLLARPVDALEKAILRIVLGMLRSSAFVIVAFADFARRVLLYGF